MAFNFGHNQRGNSRNQNPRFSSRQPGPPNQSQPFFGSPQDFLANLSSFFRPRNAPTGPRNQFNSGNQFGQNDFSFNSGFQNERPPNRPFNSDFHPRFTASKPQNEHQRKPYQSHNQDFGETNSYHPYRKESQNVQSKTEFTKRNEDNLRINEVGKEKFSEIKDDKLKIGQESDLKVDNESVDQDLCDLNDIDMEIDDEDGDTDIGNIDVSDVSMSQQVEHKEKKIDKPDEKKADLPKNTLESQRQDKKDFNIQGKTNPAESPKTLEKNKDKNIQGKGTTESSKEKVVIAAKKDEKEEEEEEDSDSEDTGYCDYCKMEFATADAYWKHTRGLLHTQKLMGADTSVSRSPQNTKKTSKPQEPATSTYVPKKGELVTAAVIEANITETPTDLYESFPENKKLELSKPDIESQYKSVSGNQKSEQFKNVSGSKNLETGKPKIESQYYGEEPQSKSDSFDSYKGYSHGNDNGDDYEDLNEVGTKQENWMDVDPSEMQKVPAKERDLAPGDLGKNPFPDEFYCHLCDARCTGAVTYRMHLDGRTHKMKVIMTNRGDRAKAMKLKSMMTGSRKVITVNKEPKINKLLAECGSPLIGLQYVSEYHRDDEKAVRYVCNLCESKCDGASIISHVMGSRHRMKYFQEHHEDIYSHLMQYSSTRKKSDLNASAEMFARDLERKEGRGEVKVKMEIAPSTEKAAIQLIKTAAVQIPELLSLTGTEKSELKNDSKSKQRETEGYSDYSSGYSYHSTSSLNQRGGKSGARDGNHGYYNRANADSYEDTGSYYESFDYGHGQRGSKRSLDSDSRARGILKSGRIGSKSYTGSSGTKTGAYGGSEEWYDDSYGYGYDENYGYGTGDYSGYGGEGSYRKHKSYYGQSDFYVEDYTAPYHKKNTSGNAGDEPIAKLSRKNQPSNTFEQWEEEEDGNSQGSAGYSYNYPDEDRLSGNDQNIPVSDELNSKKVPDQEKLVGIGKSPNFPDYEDAKGGSGNKQDKAMISGASRGLSYEQARFADLSSVCEMFNDKDKELFLQFLQFKKMVESGGDLGSFGKSMMQTDHSNRYEEQTSGKPTPYPSTKDEADPYTGSPVVQKFDYGHKSSPKTTDAPKKSESSQPVLPNNEGKEGESDQPKITDMLSSLSSSLICTEEEAEMALQVSNALTQALLQYRLKKLPQNIKASLPEETKQMQQSSTMPQQQLADGSKKKAQQIPAMSNSQSAELLLPSSSISSTPSTTTLSGDFTLQDPTLPTIHQTAKQKQPLGSERGPDIHHLLNTINPKDLQKVINAEKKCSPDQVVSATPDIKQLLSSINPTELQKALSMAQNQTGGQATPSLKGDDIQKILSSISPADLQKVAAAVQSQPNPVPHTGNVSMSNPLVYGQSANRPPPSSQHMLPQQWPQMMAAQQPTSNAPPSQLPPTSQHMMPQQRPQMMSAQHPTSNVPSSQPPPTSQPMMPQQRPQMMPAQNPMSNSPSSQQPPTSQHMMPQQRPQMMPAQNPMSNSPSSQQPPTSRPMMPQQRPQMMPAQNPMSNSPSSQPPPTSQHMMPQQQPQMMPAQQTMMPQQRPQMRTEQNPNLMPQQNMMGYGMQPRMGGWNDQMQRRPQPQQGGVSMGVNPPLPQGPHPPPPPNPPPNSVKPPPPPSSQKY